MPGPEGTGASFVAKPSEKEAVNLLRLLTNFKNKDISSNKRMSTFPLNIIVPKD